MGVEREDQGAKASEGQAPGQRRSLLLRVRGENLMGGKNGSFSHL